MYILFCWSISLWHEKFHVPTRWQKRCLLSFWRIRSNNAVVCIKEETLDRRPNTFTRERFHFYGTVRVRDTLRGRTTTTTSTTRRGKRALMLVIQPRCSVCLLEFILAAARKSSGGCMRRGGATTNAIPEATSSPRNPT